MGQKTIIGTIREVFRKSNEDSSKEEKPSFGDGVASYSDDCSLAHDLNRDDRFNFDEMPKIKQANRTWQDFAKTERKKPEMFPIPFIDKRDAAAKQEVQEALAVAFGTVAVAALIAIVLHLLAMESPSALFLLLTLLFVLLIIGYAFRSHRHIAGWWKWRRQQHDRPEPLETAETVDFVVGELPISQPNYDGEVNFGSLLNLARINAHYWVLSDYQEFLEGLDPKTGIGLKEATGKDKYAESDSWTSRRHHGVWLCLLKVRAKFDEAYRASDELRNTLLPAYKKEEKEVSLRLAERQRRFHAGENEWTRQVAGKMKESRGEVVAKVDELTEALAEAREMIDKKLTDHKLLYQDELQPLPKRERSNSFEVTTSKQQDDSGSGIEQG